MNALQLKVIEMTDRRPDDTRSSQRPEWSGFAEIDRAIAENRLTSYRWQKAWADPLARIAILSVVLVLVAFVAFVVVYDVLGWR